MTQAEVKPSAAGTNGRQNGTPLAGMTGVRALWNLGTAALYEEAIRRGEGILTAHGPFNADTGQHTGRSPKDKFLVKEASTDHEVWWGPVNKPISSENFSAVLDKVLAHFNGRDAFVQDLFVCADPNYRLPLRVITEQAWHSLFARTMFIPPEDAGVPAEEPQFTVIQAPSIALDPATYGLRSQTFILLSFEKRLIVVGGTSYAGEIKKGMFTVLNYLMPKRDVLSMHCSANIGDNGDVALFFGLSGTGKTTLSADPERRLIGDDEHGWHASGVFNFEGGCYAKMIKLSPEAEPQIFATTRMFGTVLENVVVDPVTRELDLDSEEKTENTRGAYPLSFNPVVVPSRTGGHPSNVVLLTADAFGVLPPISRLTRQQAEYHFLSGYTAKVAGTEKGVIEPQATFSTCFADPFLVLHPGVYARMLGDRLEEHGSKCWLVNTGWVGGAYGVGERIKIRYTRAMVKAALNGELDDVETVEDPIFGLQIPTSCPNVPSELLVPRNSWPDKAAYDEVARGLARSFRENFKQFEDGVSDAVKAAAPQG